MAFLKSLPVRPVVSRPVYGGREKREIPEFPEKTETGKTGNEAPNRAHQGGIHRAGESWGNRVAGGLAMACLTSPARPFPNSPAPIKGLREISGKQEAGNSRFREVSGNFGDATE